MLWQSILLTRAGNVLRSKGTILPAHQLLHLSLPETMPFFQSIWPSIALLPIDAFPLVYPGVKSPHHLLKGIYDISILPEQLHFRCQFMDKTKFYQAKQREMQALLGLSFVIERQTGVFAKKNFLS